MGYKYKIKFPKTIGSIFGVSNRRTISGIPSFVPAATPPAIIYPTPTVAITSATVAHGGTTNKGTVSVTLTLSEVPSRLASLSKENVLVTNARIVSFAPRSSSGNFLAKIFMGNPLAARTFDMEIRPLEDGAVTILVPPNTYTGKVSGLYSATSNTYSFTAVTTGLVVRYVGGSSAGLKRLAGATGEEDTGFSGSGLPAALAKTSVGSILIGQNPGASGAATKTYYKNVPGAYQEVNARDGSAVIINTTVPSVSLSSTLLEAGDTTEEDKIYMKAVFSAPVWDFSSTSIVVTNGAVQQTGFTSINSAHDTFEFVVEGMDTEVNGGSVTVTVPAGAATDAMDQPNTASETFSFAKAATPPALLFTSPDVNFGANIQPLSTVTVTATLRDTTDKPLITWVPGTVDFPKTNLKVWMKAESLDENYANGDLVTSWSDSSDSGFIGTSTRSPSLVKGALNGISAVRFAGSQEVILPYNAVNTPGGDNLSVFVVYSPATSTNTTAPILSRASQASGWATPFYAWGFGARNNATAKQPIFNYSTTANAIILTNSFYSPSDGVPVIASSVKSLSLGTLKTYLGGYLTGSVSGATVATKVASSAIYIGGTQQLNAAESFKGDIYEILIYSSALSDSDRQKVEGYLADKYAVQSSLASLKSTASSYAMTLASASSQYVSAPTSASLPTVNQPYTIEAWIKPTTHGDSQIVCWGTGTQYKANFLKLGTGNTITAGWWSADLTATLGASLADGQWHHVATTYDNATRKIYVDGVVVGSDTPGAVHNVLSPATGFRIGSRFDNLQYYNGAVDEVRVWNVARTAVQLATGQSLQIDPSTAGLVAYYRMEEGSGTSVVNLASTGSALNGTVVNSASYIAAHPYINAPALTGDPYWDTNFWFSGASLLSATQVDDYNYTLVLNNLQDGLVKTSLNVPTYDPVSGQSDEVDGEFSFTVSSTQVIATALSQTLASGGSTQLSVQPSPISSLSGVSGYFASTANWRLIVLNYRSQSGKQVTVTVPANASTAQSTFRTNAPAGTVFYLTRIIIQGKNKSRVSIRRAAIPTPTLLDITIT